MWIALCALAVGICSLLMNFARTPPDEAKQNLSKWLAKLSLWERCKAVVTSWWGRTISILVVVGSLLYLISPHVFNPKWIVTSTVPQTPPSPTSSTQPKATYGGLYKWQIDILVNGVAGYSTIVIARPRMIEPQTFARMFANVFRTIVIEPLEEEQKPNAPNQTGVRIGVVNINEPPSAAALKMQDVIRRMGFEGDFIQLRDEPLAFAKQNGGFAIYIGPPPL
jgi:hypothetical protein